MVQRFIALGMLGISGLLGGCSSSTDVAASDASIISAIAFIDTAGYHEADESIQQGTIPPTTESIASKMRTALLLTHWPKDLQTPAARLAAQLGNVQTALATD